MGNEWGTNGERNHEFPGKPGPRRLSRYSNHWNAVKSQVSNNECTDTYGRSDTKPNRGLIVTLPTILRAGVNNTNPKRKRGA